MLTLLGWAFTRFAQPQKGINIVHLKDGSMKKILVK